ncbi:CAAX prenyl protease-related protein [Geobacter sp.]|uniref:CAAX prenyl protease-related protein n=1 Tax=Geobacter sp. TaxID=46610 RepID=UPI002621E29A|nr:CAAX prenyl protease-related protein [Geobacter sp.]
MLTRNAAARIVPFATYMAFIAVEELLRYAGEHGVVPVGDRTLLFIYPVKIAAVIATLLYSRRSYGELRSNDLRRLSQLTASLLVGIVVFILWINMDWVLGTSTPPRGFDPSLFGDGALRTTMILVRLGGAVLVVPIMEELFWRSFFIRYIVDGNFEQVPIGFFSWSSFVATVILFGLEHHYVFAGIAGGVLYNLLLYRTKSIAQCIVAHAATNLALGIYVLQTGKWRFW